MAKKRETNLQRRIQKAIRDEFPNIFMFKVHGNEFQPSGIPDLLGCVCGIFFAIEVKLPEEGVLSQLQIDTIEEIAEAGGVVGVAETVEEALAIVRKARALATGSRRPRPRR